MAPPLAAPVLTEKQERLLEQLRQAKTELTGQQIHAQLRQSSLPMGLATVYRHLRQLQQRGLLRCRHLPSGEALYAPTERDEHHLTCVDCGRTLTLDSCPMHDVHLHGDQLQGFALLFHTLEFFGICATCRAAQASAQAATPAAAHQPVAVDPLERGASASASRKPAS